MFNKLRKQLHELASSDDGYLLVPAFEKLIDKVENRYEKYEATLKEIASYEYKDDYSLSLKRDLCRLAKEVLVSDEEIQIKQLREILADFDKEIISEVLKYYK